MVNIIGVRFRDSGKVYHFSAEDMQIQAGQNVIVETARGVEYGHVVFGNRQISEDKVAASLKPVIRIATEEDDSRNTRNKEKGREAYKVCVEKIKKHDLEMKLIDCEYTFDNNKVLFYFTADGRIDFRELVKDLAAVFKTRIELRQIGVRDETKIKGGIGICGRSLCCHTFLSDFAPVSIKMAKEQNLSLNPTKISGMCGRLMCCLKNEQETYEYLNKKLPRVGDEITFRDDMKGVVHEVSVLRQRVKVIITDAKGEKELMEIKVDEIETDSGNRKKKDKNNKEKGQKAGKDNKPVKDSADTIDPKEISDNKEYKDKKDNKNQSSSQTESIDYSGEKSLIGADSLEENRRLFRMRAELQNESESGTANMSDRPDEKKNKSGKNRNKGNKDSSVKNNRNTGQKGGNAKNDSGEKGSKDTKGRDKASKKNRGKRNKNANSPDVKGQTSNLKESGTKANAGSQNLKQGKNSGKNAQSKNKKPSGKHFRNHSYRGKKRNENSRNEERGENRRSSN